MTKIPVERTKKLATNVYIPIKLRQYLEELAVEVGFKRGRQMTASSFLQGMLIEYGEVYKATLINNDGVALKNDVPE